MKTEYSPIVALKKRDVERIGLQIGEIERQIAHQKEKIEAARQNFNELESPLSGVFGLFSHKSLYIKAFQHEMRQLDDRLKTLLNLAMQARNELKIARIDYERFLNLDKEARKKQIKKLEYREAQMLDELGNIRHHLKNGA